MPWMTYALAAFIVVGLILIVFSTVRVHFAKPYLPAVICGILCWSCAGFGAYWVLRSPPTTDETIEEQPIDVVPIPESTLERLRLAWDADGVADWPAAGALAEISEIAYLPPNEADTKYRELGFTEIMPIVQGSMIGYVISGEDVTVIAFRGTDFGEISDWLANLGTTAMQTSHGSIHRGFYAAYDSMKVQVDSILQARDAKHLWVTGHSLGGALALVCAYDLVETEQRALDGVITFGQPMVASQPFAKYIDTLLVGRYARFVNREDIVPRVPPGYVTCGSLVWFTDGGLRRSKVQRIAMSMIATESLPEPIAAELREEVDVTPMSDAEFAAMQSQLKAENAEKERLPEGTLMRYESTAAPVDDHSIWTYVEKVRKLIGIASPVVVPL